MKIGALTSIAAAAVAASLPLAAHHSFSAEFDGSKEIKATGAVTKLDWQNPHGWIHLTVTEICERTAAARRSRSRSGESSHVGSANPIS